MLVFQRRDTRAFATKCLSQPSDGERVELHMLTDAQSAAGSEVVELLTAVAHFHRHGEPLGLGHSVDFGRPWVGGSTCSFGLVSLPYPDGPALEWMSEPRVRFLWRLPITRAEREFKKARGTEALEQRFEEAQLDVLDPRRASVV